MVEECSEDEEIDDEYESFQRSVFWVEGEPDFVSGFFRGWFRIFKTCQVFFMFFEFFSFYFFFFRFCFFYDMYLLVNL